jgi:hypothetical protein
MVEAGAVSVEAGPVSVPARLVKAVTEATVIVRGPVEAGSVADTMDMSPVVRRDIDDPANWTTVDHDGGNIIAVIVNGRTIAITVIVGRIAVTAIPVPAIEAAKHGAADQASSKRPAEPEPAVMEAAVVEATEAASGKPSVVEATHAAHVVEAAHMAHSTHATAKASHPSLSGNGNGESGHSEHGGRQKPLRLKSEEHDAFSSCEITRVALEDRTLGDPAVFPSLPGYFDAASDR